MAIISYKLDEVIIEDRDIFCEMLTYVSPEILAIKQTGDTVLLECTDAHEEDVIEKVGYLVEIFSRTDVRAGSSVKIKTLSDFTSNHPINNQPIFEELISNGSIYSTTDGAYVYSGIFLDVFNYFSAKIASYGKETFRGIKSFEAPVLQSITEYEKGGYFESFPHHIMFQSSLKSDIENINEYSKLDSKEKEIVKYLQSPSNILRHAACVPVYPMLQDMKIDSPEPVSIMVSGRCFRNEGKNVFELARLNEFNMKEFVFIGEQEQVNEHVKKAKALWDYWIELFELNGLIATANDSFFANNYKKLKVFQIIGDSKQELKLLLPSSQKLCAVSSANYHRTHFTKSYNIKSDNVYAHTACVAFGIERLTYSLLSQKGICPEKWDSATLKEIYA